MRPVPFPTRGATNATAFIDGKPGFAPVENLRNVRAFVPGSDRPTGGTRAGLVEVFTQLGSGPVQGFCSVNRQSISSGFTLGDPVDCGSGVSHSAVAPSGNLWVLDGVPSVLWTHTLTDTIASGLPYPKVTASAFTQDGTILVIAHSEINVNGKQMVKVRAIRMSDRSTLWTVTYNDAGTTDKAVRRVVCSSKFAFICASTNILAVHLTTGVLYEPSTCNGWAYEIRGAGVFTSGTTEYLMVAFDGSRVGSNPGDMVGGGTHSLPTSVDGSYSGLFASQFRAGIMKFRIYANDTQGPFPPGHPLTRTNLDGSALVFGTQLASGAPGTEYGAPHNYFRVWEHSAGAPRGCIIGDMAVGSDGTCVCVRCNQGWGPAAFPWRPGCPDVGPQGPDISVFKVRSNGTMQWEQYTGVDVQGGLGSGYYNDGTDHFHYNDITNPTLRAVAMDAAGAVYVAGFQNPSGFSLHRLSTNGSIDWYSNVVQAGYYVADGGLRIDPTDGNLIVTAQRTSGWDGGTYPAHVFKVASSTGRIIWAFDAAGVDVPGLCVAVSGQGKIALGTEYVP